MTTKSALEFRRFVLARLAWDGVTDPDFQPGVTYGEIRAREAKGALRIYATEADGREYAGTVVFFEGDEDDVLDFDEEGAAAEGVTMLEMAESNRCWFPGYLGADGKARRL